MCPCGGEMTVWCFACGDWICDDCGHGGDCPARAAHHEYLTRIEDEAAEAREANR